MSIYDLDITYYERFINDGSPTGQTFNSSSSAPTSPLHCPGKFLLPFLEIDEIEMSSVGPWDEILDPLGCAEHLLPIHPDIIPMLKSAMKRQLVWHPKHIQHAVPTASPRTVTINLDHIDTPVHLKLDYPKTLGRYSNTLSGEKLHSGMIISSYLDSKISDIQFGFLPEVAVAEAPIYVDGAVGGALIRLHEVRGIPRLLSKDSQLIPAFSLFGRDKLNPESLPLIVSLCKNSDTLVNNFIKPVLLSYWKLSIEHGLIPEAHSQNFLFLFNRDLQRPVVVWRDFQGFLRDELLISEELLTSLLGDYHLLRASDKESAASMRSFRYDWILGEYYLKPLIATASKYCSINTASVYEHIRHITRKALSQVPQDYLPKDYWYSMSLMPVCSERLPLLKNDNPNFR